jgi:hypothetical protein
VNPYKEGQPLPAPSRDQATARAMAAEKHHYAKLHAEGGREAVLRAVYESSYFKDRAPGEPSFAEWRRTGMEPLLDYSPLEAQIVERVLGKE